ncbi:MAG: hypothetical protein M3N09_01760 [Actinomycetota bacterium]|nr:hypothetical protein [Actinomycetota bacterium]
MRAATRFLTASGTSCADPPSLTPAPEFVAPQTVDGIGHLEVSATHVVLG